MNSVLRVSASFNCYIYSCSHANVWTRAKYVSNQMRFETSFIHEASNARRCAEFLERTTELRDDVYVPRVYGKDEGCLESDRVMVMEWIDGCRYVCSSLEFPERLTPGNVV